jgi:hypothetical protein
MALWHERQEDKKELMEENAKKRAARSDAQQIEELDFRLGKGEGAKKERARLAERMAKK